jgi:predicted transcriptional regulator
MSKPTTADILNVLTGKSDGLTATAIAKALNISKAAPIKDLLSELVSNGSIEIDASGRYEVYKLVKKVAKVEPKKETVAKVEPKKETVTVVAEKAVEKLPEASFQDLVGYHVDTVKIKDKTMKRITTPDGKKIRMETDEKLLVINNEPKYVIKTAEDTITCIRKYAMDTGLTVFTVSDLKQNKKISNDKDVEIKDDHILFMTIKKHNKAA